MQMSSRVRRSWKELAEQLQSCEAHEVASRIRPWITASLAQVSTLGADRIARAGGLQRLIATPDAALPTSRRAVRDAVAALQSDAPTDPERLVDVVDRIAWTLVCYRLPDESCPKCQGDLDVWTTSKSAVVLICNVLGCLWSTELKAEQGPEVAPADRARVLAEYPDADLVHVAKSVSQVGY